MSTIQITIAFSFYFASALVVLASTQDRKDMNKGAKSLNALLALIPGINTATAGMNLLSKALR